MKRNAYWAIWASLTLCCLISAGPVHAASVTLDREEFIAMLANVDLLKRKLATADEQIRIHVKAKDQRETVIALQVKHIAELESMVKTYEEMNRTQDELIADIEKKFSLKQDRDLYQWLSMGIMAVAIIIIAVVK